MKKQRKELDERGKRLVFYLCIIISSFFVGGFNPNFMWLTVGVTVGMLYGIGQDWIPWLKKKKNGENPDEVSTESEKTVENKNDSDDQ